MADHEDRQRWRVAMLDTLHKTVDADTRGLASGAAVGEAPPSKQLFNRIVFGGTVSV